jgi:hypothetical protein
MFLVYITKTPEASVSFNEQPLKALCGSEVLDAIRIPIVVAISSCKGNSTKEITKKYEIIETTQTLQF